MWRLLPLVWLGCGGPEPVDPQCEGAGSSRVLLVSDIRFVRADAGVSDGFDLDESASGACGVTQYTGPDGAPGIDNAFAALLPALELTEARTMEDIIAASVRSGELLILIRLDDLDDARDDACVDLRLQRGVGQPLLGNDGEVLAGQTFALNDGVAESHVAGVELVAGRVDGGPITLELPVRIFEYEFDFTLRDGRVRVQFDDDGRARGLLAGGLPVESLLAVAANPDVDPSLYPLIEGLLGQFADLAPDASGACTQLSMTFAFEAVDAFIH